MMRKLCLAILYTFLIGCQSLNVDEGKYLHSKLTFEVAYIESCQPSKEDLNYFTDQLHKYHIAERVEFQTHKVKRDPVHYLPWNLVSLMEFEIKNRRNPDSIFISYVPGFYNDGTIHFLGGIQYSPKAFTVFKTYVGNAEGSILIHEYCHALGIAKDRKNPVNPNRPHHCNNPKCIMFWQVEPNLDFDEECLRELILIIRH